MLSLSSTTREVSMHGTDHPLKVHVGDTVVVDLHARVGRLEADMSHIKTRDQDTRTELALMKLDMQYVKESVGGIQKGINRILWAIGLSVLAAATTFVLSGGLVVVKQ